MEPFGHPFQRGTGTEGELMVEEIDAVIAVPVAVLVLAGVVWRERAVLAEWLGVGHGEK